MVKIESTLIHEKELEENKSYIIESVERIEVKGGFSGLKLKAKSTDKKDENTYTTMLWDRDEVGLTSKLGSMLEAMSIALDTDPTETQNWIGKKIRVLHWQNKNRAIEVVI